ncbi:Exonuclease SbcC [Actinacidiphila bryophytorum]|uniref:Exonuclease SbcC n=1 Tax=Actinacidiphila bryophytorum TaxID=1436133 RepID=A0A9W4GW53_9ACTN|nr:Exonuclease SbcC [Actinacidiphila bryophytorum]
MGATCCGLAPFGRWVAGRAVPPPELRLGVPPAPPEGCPLPAELAPAGGALWAGGRAFLGARGTARPARGVGKKQRHSKWQDLRGSGNCETSRDGGKGDCLQQGAITQGRGELRAQPTAGGRSGARRRCGRSP